MRLCFMSLFPVFSLTLHVSGLHRPIISGYLELLFICYHLVHVVFVDRPCALRTGLWRWPCCTDFAVISVQQGHLHKHYTNQMVA
jgi:hypothetical protein